MRRSLSPSECIGESAFASGYPWESLPGSCREGLLALQLICSCLPSRLSFGIRKLAAEASRIFKVGY